MTTPIQPMQAGRGPAPEPIHVVAISGGKDSTAMALGLMEREPRDYAFIITPTGDELPEMVEHWARLEVMLGAKFIRLGRHTLDSLIGEFNALPNHRQRWCTRMLKIEPALAWVKAQGAPVVMHVGLRADEEERRGIYSADVETDFPLRRWGWGLADVRGYLRARGVVIPERTDCARCYGQRIGEWFRLWRDHPEIFESAAAQEERTGHTFRSPSRDTWPAPLRDLAAEFARGRLPLDELRRQRKASQLCVIDDEPEQEACRVCRL